MIKNNNKGFTLIELLVVVLILGILAAMAMPQYFKAVERSRMTEADQLLGSIAQAQQRKYLQINKYAEKFQGLDVAPKGATDSSFCTKGTVGQDTCGSGNGFLITLSGTTYHEGIARARRVGPNTLQYNYMLSRHYGNTGTTCEAGDANGAGLCNDFCGVDTLTKSGDKCCANGTAGADGGCAAPSAAGSGL